MCGMATSAAGCHFSGTHGVAERFYHLHIKQPTAVAPLFCLAVNHAWKFDLLHPFAVCVCV
jgi:hypothetical protein